MKSYALIIPESGNIQFKEYDFDNDFFEIEYKQLRKLIKSLNHSFFWFDATSIMIGNVSCIMFCNDVDLCSNDWRDHINVVASLIYDHTIAGDVIILADHLDGGSYSFTKIEMDIIHKWFDMHCASFNFDWK